jgi:uncharacterized coiled-coil DUF342 family protein
MCQDFYPEIVRELSTQEVIEYASNASKEITNLNNTIKSLRDLLAQQAARADALVAERDAFVERAIKSWRTEVDCMRDERDAALAREVRLREALEKAVQKITDWSFTVYGGTISGEPPCKKMDWFLAITSALTGGDYEDTLA